MINKLKFSFLAIFMAAFAFAGVNSALAASALVFTSDYTLTINGNDYTIVSGSEATTLAVNSLTAVAVVPDTKSFTVTSAGGHTLTNDQSVTPTCSTGTTTLAYTNTTGGPVTLTITPSVAIFCEGAHTGGGSSSHHSGGGGGGGSSSNNNDDEPAAPGTVPVTCAPGQMFSAVTGERCTSTNVVFCATGQMFSPTTGERCNTYLPPTSGGVSTMPTPAGGYAFGTALIRQGSKGEGCRAWQMFLNDKAMAGLVTDGNCGPKTMAAARAWQSVSGLVADGILGAMSRAKANMQ